LSELRSNIKVRAEESFLGFRERGLTEGKKKVGRPTSRESGSETRKKEMPIGDDGLMKSIS